MGDTLIREEYDQLMYLLVPLMDTTAEYPGGTWGLTDTLITEWCQYPTRANRKDRRKHRTDHNSNRIWQMKMADSRASEDQASSHPRQDTCHIQEDSSFISVLRDERTSQLQSKCKDRTLQPSYCRRLARLVVSKLLLLAQWLVIIMSPHIHSEASAIFTTSTLSHNMHSFLTDTACKFQYDL